MLPPQKAAMPDVTFCSETAGSEGQEYCTKTYCDSPPSLTLPASSIPPILSPDRFILWISKPEHENIVWLVQGRTACGALYSSVMFKPSKNSEPDREGNEFHLLGPRLNEEKLTKGPILLKQLTWFFLKVETNHYSHLLWTFGTVFFVANTTNDNNIIQLSTLAYTLDVQNEERKQEKRKRRDTDMRKSRYR